MEKTKKNKHYSIFAEVYADVDALTASEARKKFLQFLKKNKMNHDYIDVDLISDRSDID